MEHRGAEARRQLASVAKLLHAKCAQAAEVLEDAAEDVLAYMAFPAEHWRQIHSTNPLERLNKEVRRRTRVVGIFPSRTSPLLVTAVLTEQDDEWHAAERSYFSATKTGANPPLTGHQRPSAVRDRGALFAHTRLVNCCYARP